MIKECSMRVIATVLLATGMALAQNTTEAPKAAPGAATSNTASPTPSADASKQTLTIPSGTKVALVLKQAISTKTAKEGDAVYAETSFPFVVDERVIIPAGTYIQGKIASVKRGGHVKGRAELLMHFTTMIYPNGYTVMLPGGLENVPGAEKSTVNDEGKVKQDSQTGEKVGTMAKAAGTGALIGAVADGGKGAGIGAGIGGLAWAAIGMLSRGADVRLDAGTSVEMVIQRAVEVDANRVMGRQSTIMEVMK
jgi:hypothetical protein